MNITVTGDCRETMRAWAADGVRAQMCVTSPPYFGLRSYGGGDAEIGKEATPEQYIANMVDVFRCVPMHWMLRSILRSLLMRHNAAISGAKHPTRMPGYRAGTNTGD